MSDRAPRRVSESLPVAFGASRGGLILRDDIGQGPVLRAGGRLIVLVGFWSLEGCLC